MRFVIIDRESCSAEYPFTLKDRKAAEAVIETSKNKDRLEIAMVLIEK